MTGLNAKSSTEEQVPSGWGSASLSEQVVLQLAAALAQFASARLTKKQRKLLVASHASLRHHPTLSLSTLADHLSRTLPMPLSTVKFNLAVLRKAGLLRNACLAKRHHSASLSLAARLLVELLPEA
jgi:hypothetical protein